MWTDKNNIIIVHVFYALNACGPRVGYPRVLQDVRRVGLDGDVWQTGSTLYYSVPVQTAGLFLPVDAFQIVRRIHICGHYFNPMYHRKLLMWNLKLVCCLLFVT
jgi:hypothetical protein